MKHFLNFLPLFVIPMMIISCETKISGPSFAPAKVFKANFSDSSFTKTFVDSYYDLHWSESDSLSVFGGEVNERYVFAGLAGDNTGLFVNYETASDTPTWTKYYSIYPYHKGITAQTEGSFICNIPEIQKYTKNSFDPKAALMISRTCDINSTDLFFQSVCSYLKVKIFSSSNAVIKQIVLSGNNQEYISGNGLLSFNNQDLPVIELFTGYDSIGGFSEDINSEYDSSSTKSYTKAKYEINSAAGFGCKRVVIDCGIDGIKVGNSRATATEFVFALAPNVFPKGIKVETVDISGRINTKSTNKSVSLPRSTICTMDAYELGMEGGGYDIVSFCLIDQSANEYNASIIGNNTITILIPANIDKSSLIAKFLTTGSGVFIDSVKQESGVTTNDFTRPIIYTVKNHLGESKQYKINIISSQKQVACWGDSFTSYYYPYPPILQELLGPSWSVYNGGITADRSNEIAARQGAIKTIIRKINGFDFPTTTTDVNITSICTNDKKLDPDIHYPFRQNRWTFSTLGLNNCIVGGVECLLANNKVQRVEEGPVVHVNDSTEIITYGANHCKDADLIIIYMGTNGGWQHYLPNYDLLIAQHKAMIDFTSQKKYIVLTSHVSHGFDFHGGADSTYLKKMYDAFGNHVIFLRSEVNTRAEELLLKTGAYSNNSQIPNVDKEYIARGDWPLSFFMSASDEHPNKYGSKAMAILIKEKMLELGYLDE